MRMKQVIGGAMYLFIRVLSVIHQLPASGPSILWRMTPEHRRSLEYAPDADGGGHPGDQVAPEQIMLRIVVIGA